MFKFQRFSLFFWFSLLTLPAVAVDKADATAIDRRVTIQPIRVCNELDTRFLDSSSTYCATTNLFEEETDQIWSQAGIDINFLPRVNLFRSSFLTIDDDAEFTSLVAGSGNKQNSDSQVLNMWFLDTLFPETGTFGLGLLGGNGIAIASDTFTFNGGIGRRDTIAHEIGHNLGLDHNDFGAGGSLNVMTAGNAGRLVPSSINDIFPTGANTDQLTSAQISEVRSSSFAPCVSTSETCFSFSLDATRGSSVPEPSATAALMGLGIFSLYMRLKEFQ